MSAKEQSVKIPFDSLTLRAVVAELDDIITGGYVQDIRQPSAADLWLDIRNKGQNVWLSLSCDTRFARLHLTEKKPRNPPTPPNFCMVLRKYIEDGRIIAIRQRGFDRIFEMEIERRDDLGEPTTYTFIAELMGKHSNLVLINANDMVLDAAKRITHRVNRVRETLPNHHYSPPPEQTDRISPFGAAPIAALREELTDFEVFPLTTEDQDLLASLLMDTFAGMSPFLAQEVVARIQRSASLELGLKAVWTEIFDAAKQDHYSPVEAVYRGRTAGAYPFPVILLPENQQTKAHSLNFALDRGFETARIRAEFDAAAGDLKTRIEQEMRRLERQRDSVARTMQEVERADDYRKLGDLILANVWQIEAGTPKVTVQDYFDPALPDVIITLDPKLSPQENAEAYFRRYRKARDSEEMAQAQGQKGADAYRDLRIARERLLGWMQTGQETAAGVRELRDELMQSGLLRAGNEAEDGTRIGPDFQGHKIKRFTTPEGYEIYIGDSATANDFLTTRVAMPNDLWLHVRSATSSHVVIRTLGNPTDVPRSVIEKAASLCAQNSSQKHSKLVAVDYTLKKYVRKPRGSAPGSVDYSRETTLHVSP